jgi:hypothetical protein
MAGYPDEVGKVFLTRQSVKLLFYQIPRVGTTLSGQELLAGRLELRDSGEIMDVRRPAP